VIRKPETEALISSSCNSPGRPKQRIASQTKEYEKDHKIDITAAGTSGGYERTAI